MTSNRIAIAAIALLGLTCTACGQAQQESPASGDSPAAPAATATVTATKTAETEAQESGGTEGAGGDDLTRFTMTGGMGKGLYFTTGALRCGITKTATGCQAVEPVKNRPECTDPNTKAPYIALWGTEPEPCTTQGLFIAEKQAPEIKPGDGLTDGNSECKVLAVGSVTCTNQDGRINASLDKFEYIKP